MDRESSTLDDLRAQLRALGYLDAGLNRFVLAGAREARSPIAIALLASVRIGLLAGAVLGPAAAVGLGFRLPGLVTGTRDAIVLGVYLAMLFGAAAGALAFVGAFAARVFIRRRSNVARHAGRAASIGGFVVGALCLAYLTLWWRTANAGFGWHAPGWTMFALAAAVAISLLLGHTVRVTALAVFARDVGPAVLEPRRTVSFWKKRVPLAFAAFAGASVLLLSTVPRATRSQTPDFAVVPTGIRVTLLGIDGVDVQLLQQLVAKGRLPNLASVLRGATARVAPQEDRDPARVWTTIATGQVADRHGVARLERRRIAGLQGRLPVLRGARALDIVSQATDLVRLTRPIAASGAERREKALWEVAAGKGLRTLVVNWWATWPATGEDGGVITDRAALRLERGGEQDGEIAPAALYDTLSRQWEQLRTRAFADVRRTFGTIQAEPVRSVMMRSAEIDAVHVALAKQTLSEPVDLLALYLPGLDIAQHQLLSSDDSLALPPSILAERVAIVEQYYFFLDWLIAPLIPGETNRLTVLVAGPGRVAGSHDALFALRGQSAREATHIEARPVDIAPTVLFALGLPASRALAGRPLTNVFQPEFVARHPVRMVDTYGTRGSRVATAGRALDDEVIERLRSLGYVR